MNVWDANVVKRTKNLKKTSENVTCVGSSDNRETNYKTEVANRDSDLSLSTP